MGCHDGYNTYSTKIEITSNTLTAEYHDPDEKRDLVGKGTIGKANDEKIHLVNRRGLDFEFTLG